VRIRLARLRQGEIRRIVHIQPFTTEKKERVEVCRMLANELPSWMSELHARHHCVDQVTGKRVSVGLCRFANIEPLIEITRALCARGSPAGLQLHLCVYHSRHPLLVRSHIEKVLDRVLLRRLGPMNKDPILGQPEIRSALENHDELDQVFVVLASPVAEVGRDHDYDWAIVEPSSMRSVIQLAGRIRRHRPGSVTNSNVYLLEHNLRALEGNAVAFLRPGFESEEFRLIKHSLFELLTPEQLDPLDAAPRIAERPVLVPDANLVDLEHRRLRALMLAEGGSLPVSLWWQTRASLCAGLQYGQRFRKGPEEQIYALLPDEDEIDRLRFHRNDDGIWSQSIDNLLANLDLALAPGIGFWGSVDYLVALNDLADQLGLSPLDCAQRFGVVQLRENQQGWVYHPALGFSRRR